MEPLWSQAGATRGNRPQAHLPVAEGVMNPESMDDRPIRDVRGGDGKGGCWTCTGRSSRETGSSRIIQPRTHAARWERTSSQRSGGCSAPRSGRAREAAGERHTGGDGRFSESARWPAGGELRSDLGSFFVRVIVTVSVTNQEYGRERSRSTNLVITEDV